MSLLFHPKILELLLKFKKTGKASLLKTILIATLDNADHIDLSFVNHFLFSHLKEKTQTSFDISVQILKYFTKEKNSAGNYVCFARNIPRNKYTEIILENRKSPPSTIGNSSSFNLINLIKDYKRRAKRTKNLDATTQTDPIEYSSAGDFMSAPDILPRQLTVNTLNFVKTMSPAVKNVCKFTPLELKNATFVFDRHNIILDTQRKRDDLVNPVKLQFIKHYDQIRPPIYRKRGDMVRTIHSYERLPQVLDYDHDSSQEWEMVEESSTVTDITEEESDGPVDDESWVEKDSEDVEVTRYNKKPTLIFNEVQIEEYFDEKSFLNANLVMSEHISDQLKVEMLSYHANFKENLTDFVALFSELFNVMPATIFQVLASENLNK